VFLIETLKELASCYPQMAAKVPIYHRWKTTAKR
jgi:hypothetical protein